MDGVGLGSALVGVSYRNRGCNLRFSYRYRGDSGDIGGYKNRLDRGCDLSGRGRDHQALVRSRGKGDFWHSYRMDRSGLFPPLGFGLVQTEGLAMGLEENVVKCKCNGKSAKCIAINRRYVVCMIEE